MLLERNQNSLQKSAITQYPRVESHPVIAQRIQQSWANMFTAHLGQMRADLPDQCGQPTILKKQSSTLPLLKKHSNASGPLETNPSPRSWPLLVVGLQLTRFHQQYQDLVYPLFSLLLGFTSPGAVPYQLQMCNEDKEFASNTYLTYWNTTVKSLRKKDRGWVGWRYRYNFKYC